MSRTIRYLMSFFVLFAMVSAVVPQNGNAAPLANLPAGVQTATNARTSAPDTTYTVYAENLNAAWSNWSYSSSVTVQDPAYHHNGSYSVSCQYTGAWGGLFFGTD